MGKQKLVGALVISAALAGGGVAGAILGTPSISGAQTGSTATAGAVAHGPRDGGMGLDAAASALGMTTDELKAELESGKTIAQVANEKGVDVNTVIDAMVAAAQTNLRDRITDFVNNGAPMRGDHRPGHGDFGRGAPHLDAAAAALGISADELRSDLQSGKTMADVANDKGVDVQTVIDAVAADETKEIDQLLADGKISQSQADQMKANATQHATDIVNGTLPTRPPGDHDFGDHGFGGPGFGGPGFPHDAPPADSSSSSSSS